jgi:glycine betaine transporter
MGKNSSSSLLNKSSQVMTYFIDICTINAIIFGVAATIGMGVLQLEGGLHTFLNWKAGPMLEMAILLVVTAAYITSTLKGLEKGIKVLSNINLWLSIVLLGCIAYMGPTFNMVYAFFHSLPAYLFHLQDMSLGLGNFREHAWVGNWTVKYWTWWIAWAPFVGLFIAFISKGRTLRELVMGVMIAPTIFSCLWFTIFGETAIDLQQTQHFAGNYLSLSDVSAILFGMLNRINHSQLLSWLSLLLVAINFINSADSATYTIACLSVRDLDKIPSGSLQILWGILFSGLAALLLLTGGIEILQEVTTITVLPFTLLLVIIFVYLVFNLVSYSKPNAFSKVFNAVSFHRFSEKRID